MEFSSGCTSTSAVERGDKEKTDGLACKHREQNVKQQTTPTASASTREVDETMKNSIITSVRRKDHMYTGKQLPYQTKKGLNFYTIKINFSKTKKKWKKKKTKKKHDVVAPANPGNILLPCILKETYGWLMLFFQICLPLKITLI
eukprot:9195433-Ditylum_brightwellii.AAC.1